MYDLHMQLCTYKSGIFGYWKNKYLIKFTKKEISGFDIITT